MIYCLGSQYVPCSMFYDLVVTRCGIVVTRYDVHLVTTRSFLVTTRCASRNYEIASRNYEIVSRYYEIASRNYEVAKTYHVAYTGFRNTGCMLKMLSFYSVLSNQVKKFEKLDQVHKKKPNCSKFAVAIWWYEFGANFRYQGRRKHFQIEGAPKVQTANRK